VSRTWSVGAVAALGGVVGSRSNPPAPGVVRQSNYDRVWSMLSSASPCTALLDYPARSLRRQSLRLEDRDRPLTIQVGKGCSKGGVPDDDSTGRPRHIPD
jgi:hypothetical protein